MLLLFLLLLLLFFGVLSVVVIFQKYEPYRKAFYEVHPDMAQLNAWEVKQLRNELQVSSCEEACDRGGGQDVYSLVALSVACLAPTIIKADFDHACVPIKLNIGESGLGV